jgi:hypothetical protein
MGRLVGGGRGIEEVYLVCSGFNHKPLQFFVETKPLAIQSRLIKTKQGIS